jgi:hypothetical protein
MTESIDICIVITDMKESINIYIVITDMKESINICIGDQENQKALSRIAKID